MREFCLYISNVLRDHPRYFIFGFGVLGFAIFYFIALVSTGLHADLFINLAASSLVIAVTTLIVDTILEKHRRLDLQGAATQGVSKIQMANFEVVTMVGDYHFHDLKALQKEHLDNLLKKKNKKNYVDDYFIRLLNLDNEKLLDGMSARQFTELRKDLERSMRVHAEVMDVYAYSFNNKLRENLIRWNEITELLVYSISDRELNQRNGYIRASQIMSIYLSNFQEFQKLIRRL